MAASNGGTNRQTETIVVRELESSPSVKLKSQIIKEQNGSAGSIDTQLQNNTPLPPNPCFPGRHNHFITMNQSDPALSSQHYGLKINDVPKLSRSMERIGMASPYKNDILSIDKLTEHILSVPQIILKHKRTLEEKEDKAKVLSIDWHSNSHHLLTSLQNGHIYVWDTNTKERVHDIKTPCTWVFTAAYSPTENFVAAGGLDSKCDVYKLSHKLPNGKENAVEIQHVAQHQSYVLSCSFTTSDHQILTASSDSVCALWDVESAHLIKDFKGHTSDVTSLDFQKSTGYCFASGSADKQVGIWDMRTGACVQSFRTHTDEVNQVRFFPNGEAVASVSDDLTCRLFDLRMDAELAVYKKSNILFPACSVDFSVNGRLLFVGYGDHSFHIWDTLKNSHCGSVYSHENKVNAIRLCPDGSTLATASWDQTIKLWSFE